MDVRLLEKDRKTGKIIFLVKDTIPAFVNTIRRMIIDEVPTMAIEDVEFRKNNTILYDEIVAHRLGLVPLKTDLKTYNLPEKCKCEGKGCAKCTLVLTMKASARSDQIVTASEIKSKDPKVVPVYPETPVIKLLKGQQIEIEATAVLGKGKEHLKWSPGIAYYKYKPSVEISKNPKKAEEVAKRCPQDVFDCKDGKLSVNKDNLFSCHLCGECSEVSGGAVKADKTENEFLFYVEPFGQLSAKQMVTEAADIFQEKLDEFAEKIKS